ncbi:unnamed protein product [Phaeothamnion confervicola]
MSGTIPRKCCITGFFFEERVHGFTAFLILIPCPFTSFLVLPAPPSARSARQSGEICLDILKREWSPAWNLQGALRAIVALLLDPAADSPLNCDAGNMIRGGDMRAFRSMARMYTIEHAAPSAAAATQR